MKCKKCGNTLGKNGRCTHCDRQKARNTKIIAGVAAVLAVIVGVVLCLTLLGGEENETPETDALTGMHHVEIEIQDYGTISLELNADAAPITVENFLSLAESGFYNGLTFHRIMEGFMMQGGDPQGTGMGGSDQTIKGEFSQNGVDNPLSHTRGAISMARSKAMDSASSQFFIVHEDSLFLDGQYACFGYVTDGMDVVDAICTSAQPIDDNGTIPAGEQPAIVEVRVID